MSGRVDGQRLVVEAPTGETTITSPGRELLTTTRLHIEDIEHPVNVHPGSHPPTQLAPTASMEVSPGGTRVTINPGSGIVLGFDTAATITHSETGVGIDFQSETQVRVLPLAGPRRTLQVSPTPTGAANAISHAATAHLVTGPARSHPAFRTLPPKVEITDSEPTTRSTKPPHFDSHTTIETPPDLATIFQVAPLAYYLGATVTPTSETTPVLRGPDTEVELTPVDERPQTLLEELFRMDCQVRTTTADNTASPINEFVETDFDPTTVRTATPIKRLATYRDLDSDTVVEDRRPWHFAAYVDPTPDSIPALPMVLDRLAHVYLPTAEPLAPQTLMERSLDDFYRSRRPTPTVDLVEPTLRNAGIHAWIADDIPVDAFHLPPKIAGRTGQPTIDADPPLDVTLILNDPDMIGEEDRVTTSYRTHSAVELTLERHHELTCNELETTLAEDVDLLHFVGHCEPSGLVCTDGNLPANSIDSVGARTVFINACGSYHEGAALVDGGATAAAITYRGVLDGQAETVGAAFARLITQGFSLERTISMARRRVMMGMDYGIVGDGTHRLTNRVDPVRYLVTPQEPKYEVTCETFADGIIGDTRDLPLPGVDTPRFQGETATRTLSEDDLTTLLEATEAPILFDGSFAWPKDLLATLNAERGG